MSVITTHVTQQSAMGVNWNRNETHKLSEYDICSRLDKYTHTDVTWAYVVRIGQFWMILDWKQNGK